jgi:hypothetical protein
VSARWIRFLPGRHGATATCLGLLVAAACGGAATAGSGAGRNGAGDDQRSAPVPRAAASRATEFDGARAFGHLEAIVAIGPRPSGSPELAQTRVYITRALESAGITVDEQRFTAATPRGPIEMVNLLARLPGRRSTRILLTGHYDTKRLANARFVGASDGGSSAAWLLEAARVLAARPSREFTYELVWLDGEEATCHGWTECGTAATPDNTYGSRHYVAEARRTKTLASIGANILVDMIGDRDLELRRDTNSTPWLVDLLWSTARTLALDRIFVNVPTSVDDDHVPFLEAGVPSVDLIDLDTYPYWHTPDDTLDKVSAASLQAVGDVVLAALPQIEARLVR